MLHGYSPKVRQRQYHIHPPLIEYRFRADYDGVQFWSAQTKTRLVSDCETASVILPGGMGEMNVSIEYEYDRSIAKRAGNGYKQRTVHLIKEFGCRALWLSRTAPYSPICSGKR
jgi:hypothetical protein